MRTILPFTILCLATTSLLAQDRFASALSLPRRTANLVFRERIEPKWLPDGKSFWYRVQTGRRSHEFVLIDAETGERRSAANLGSLGLPEPGVVKTSTAAIDLRQTRRTGESSGLKFVNQLDADVDLFWINPQGEHIDYGQVRAGAEREQHSYDGHVWLIASRSGEHLAVIEVQPTMQTVIIDGQGVSRSREVPRTRDRSNRSRPWALF
jgi:dipeptidyl-peptidase 4